MHILQDNMHGSDPFDITDGHQFDDVDEFETDGESDSEIIDNVINNVPLPETRKKISAQEVVSIPELNVEESSEHTGIDKVSTSDHINNNGGYEGLDSEDEAATSVMTAEDIDLDDDTPEQDVVSEYVDFDDGVPGVHDFTPFSSDDDTHTVSYVF